MSVKFLNIFILSFVLAFLLLVVSKKWKEKYLIFVVSFLTLFAFIYVSVSFDSAINKFVFGANRGLGDDDIGYIRSEDSVFLVNKERYLNQDPMEFLLNEIGIDEKITNPLDDIEYIGKNSGFYYFKIGEDKFKTSDFKILDVKKSYLEVNDLKLKDVKSYNYSLFPGRYKKIFKSYDILGFFKNEEDLKKNINNFENLEKEFLYLCVSKEERDKEFIPKLSSDLDGYSYLKTGEIFSL